MAPRDRAPLHPGRIPTLFVAGLLAIFVAVAAPRPAGATLTSITSSPESPTTCDSVIVAIAGTAPTPCYEVYRLSYLEPFELPTMGPIPTFQVNVSLVLRETTAPDSEACPAVIQPYERSLRLDHLRFGTYQVKVTEYIMRAGSDTREPSSELTGWFQVGYDEACPNPFDCYYLRFIGHEPLTRLGACSGSAAPGGTACVEVGLATGFMVGGLQTTVVFDSPELGGGVHAVSVEPVGRAEGFQVAWTAEGSSTKILLYSTQGDSIPPGGDAILHICYAVGEDVRPGIYTMRFGPDTIASDPEGDAIPACPRFATIEGRLCIGTPGCDLNGDDQSNILDIVQLVNCALDGSEACPDTVSSRADCNGDGSIDVRDVVCCVRHMLALDRSVLPVMGDPPGQPTRIGFEGPVEWVTPFAGRAELTVEPGSDFGATDLSLYVQEAGARISGIHLVSGNGYQLESKVDPDGSGARAVLLALSSWSGPAVLRVDLASTTSGAGGFLGLGYTVSATRHATWMGTSEVSSTSAIPAHDVPRAPAVSAARPNPFREGTEVSYVLPTSMRARLHVYDVSGRLVRTLVDADLPAGTHLARWDGKSDSGKAVSSGIYFFRFAAGDVAETRRMMLIR